MEIVDLPEHLYANAVALWDEAGLTRPWSDPDADLRRAMVGLTSAVLAALVDGSLSGTAMVGHDGLRGWIYTSPSHPRVSAPAPARRSATPTRSASCSVGSSRAGPQRPRRDR